MKMYHATKEGPGRTSVHVPETLKHKYRRGLNREGITKHRRQYAITHLGRGGIEFIRQMHRRYQ